MIRRKTSVKLFHQLIGHHVDLQIWIKLFAAILASGVLLPLCLESCGTDVLISPPGPRGEVTGVVHVTACGVRQPPEISKVTLSLKGGNGEGSWTSTADDGSFTLGSPPGAYDLYAATVSRTPTVQSSTEEVIIMANMTISVSINLEVGC